MKKVIDGSLYNTETAKRLGVWENMADYNNFGYCSEELYQTKSGKYFLYGEGQGLSKYATIRGNSSGYGEHIEPLTSAEAAEWAEKNLDADEYIKLFGEPEEATDNKDFLNLSIPTSTKRKLEKMRAETGKSISQIITEIVESL